MKYEERTRLVFDFLFNMADGLLRAYETPQHYSADRARDEINLLVEDINGLIDGDAEEHSFNAILREIRPAVRKRHGARGWPSSKILQAATNDAIANAAHSHNSGDVEATMIRLLATHFDQRGTQLSACGSPSRTMALIDQGVLEDVRHAFVAGFDLSILDRKAASEKPMSFAETQNHFRILSRIWDCSTDEAKRRYDFSGLTPAEKQAALDAVGSTAEI